MTNRTDNKNPSATKSGPGRYHCAGHQKSRPIAPKGAPAAFSLHTASRERQLRRIEMNAIGKRAYKRLQRSMA